MNASLLTADRKTHLKIMLVACACSLGACMLAANLSVRDARQAESAASGERFAARSAADHAPVHASERLVVVSLRTKAM